MGILQHSDYLIHIKSVQDGGMFMSPTVKSILFALVWIAVFLVGIPWLVYYAGESPQFQGLWEAARQLCGVILFAGGLLLSLVCVGLLAVRGKGTPAPFDPPQRFVPVGPYRWIRNPMVLGNVLALLGYSLYFNSLALLIYALFFWLAAHLFIVFYEERDLQRRFGEEYEQYRNRTPRWWPRLG